MKTACVFCRPAQDNADPCGYCQRRTCISCHHGEKHLRLCPETRRHETRQR